MQSSPEDIINGFGGGKILFMGGEDNKEVDKLLDTLPWIMLYFDLCFQVLYPYIWDINAPCRCKGE